MNLLKISSAGIRGIVGRGLSVEMAIRFAQAFATYLDGEPLAVGRDSRPSGPMLRSAVLAGALACGNRVVDLGILPTPTLQSQLPRLGLGGAVVIAAGHNPARWNALEFLAADWSYLTARQGEELLEIYEHGEFAAAAWDGIQPLERDDSAIDRHLELILDWCRADAIRDRRFTVAVDCCNGTCTLLSPRLLEALGCRVVALNDDLSRTFPHDPDPRPENMSQLQALVKAAGADIGFAHDGEGERLGIVDETGRALDLEYTFALACLIGLEGGRCRGPVVTNLSTSRMAREVARRHGVTLERTRIGQAHVAERAAQIGADLAGEGSGQVFFPGLHPGADGIAAMAFFLEHLAASGETVSQLVEKLPRFYRVVSNLAFPPNRIFRKLQRFRDQVGEPGEEAAMDSTDGVRLSFPDGWLHVRASSTESVLRVMAEAESEGRARELSRRALEAIAE